MIHSHHQKTRFRSLTDRLCCIVVKETKILFNLLNIYTSIRLLSDQLHYRTNPKSTSYDIQIQLRALTLASVIVISRKAYILQLTLSLVLLLSVDITIVTFVCLYYIQWIRLSSIR